MANVDEFTGKSRAPASYRRRYAPPAVPRLGTGRIDNCCEEITELRRKSVADLFPAANGPSAPDVDNPPGERETFSATADARSPPLSASDFSPVEEWRFNYRSTAARPSPPGISTVPLLRSEEI